jgi:uncharacterized protein (DUF2336 family)
MKTQSPFGFDGLPEFGRHGRLAEFGRHGSTAMRPALLRVLTDLYVHRLRHTADEERHYTELALRLLEAVDTPTRIAVAMRLARHASPPPRVLQYLAGDIPEVAALVRSHPLLAPLLAPGSAIGAAPRHRDPAAPAANAAYKAQRSATTPSAIDSTRADELNEQFFAADVHERRLILLNLDIVAPIPAWLVAVSRDPSVGRRLEAAALARNREDFAQHLASALQIARAQARRVVGDDLGEPVAVAAKALGVPRDVLYRILMFVNPAVGHSVERVHALAVLYDEMPAAAAAGMVAIWQALPGGSERAEARYQPVTAEETQPRPRAAAAAPPAAQRAPVAPREIRRRGAS